MGKGEIRLATHDTHDTYKITGVSALLNLNTLDSTHTIGPALDNWSWYGRVRLCLHGCRKDVP